MSIDLLLSWEIIDTNETFFRGEGGGHRVFSKFSIRFFLVAKKTEI